MPDFDDSFLSYCERTERKRKHSYNFASARSNNGGSRSTLLSTAKNYSKTLPRSFRKNLLKISQFIRDDGDLHFYDLNHNELESTATAEERVGRASDKVESIVVDWRSSSPELLANRNLEEKNLNFSTTSDDDGCCDDEIGDDQDDEPDDDGGENNSAVVNTSISSSGVSQVSAGAATPSPSGHKGSLRGTKIARRARSFKDDFLEKISQMRTPSATMMRTHSPSNSPRNAHNNHLHHTLGSSGSGGGGRLNKGFDDSPPSPSGGHHSTSSNSTISQIVLNPNYTKTLPMLSSASSSGKQDLNYYIRQVRNSLKHFNDVVAKNKLEMLPGNGTVILDNLTDVHTALQAYALNERSSALISAKRQVYAALGELIKLCDEFFMRELKLKMGQSEEKTAADKDSEEMVRKLKVKEVTELMEAALHNLIQVSDEKLQEQNAARGAFPVGLLITDQNENLLQRPVDVASQRTSLPDIPLTPRELDILQSKANNHALVRGSHSIESVLCDKNMGRSQSPSPLPPPKPPLPNRLSDAPPLPPKRKNLQLHQQFSHPAVAAALEADFMAPLERTSWRSKSPEDNSSLLSVSAGSLDSSTLNQSRDEDLFEMEQLVATSSTSSSKSPSQYQYQQLEEAPAVLTQLVGGRLPTLSVTGIGGEAPQPGGGLVNGNNDTRYVFSSQQNGQMSSAAVLVTANGEGRMNRLTETQYHQQHLQQSHQQNTFMSTANRMQICTQTFTNRTQYADRFQTLYSSANVRVRVVPLSLSMDGGGGGGLRGPQSHSQLSLGSNGACGGQLMSPVGDSYTLARPEEEPLEEVKDHGAGRGEELPPKLPEKQRKNSNRDQRKKSIYDNMSPGGSGGGGSGGGVSPNCDAVDGTVELRDKMTVQGVLQHQQQFQKVTITKHQSVFEPRQMQSFRTNIASAVEGADNGDGEEHPPPLPFKKRHMFQSVAYSVMAYMEMIGNYSATTHHMHGGGPMAVTGELLSYDARAIAQSAEFQQRSVSMMPSLSHLNNHNYPAAYGSSGTPSLSSSSTTATFSSNSTSLSGAISNLTVVDEKPPALPPKRSRLPSGTSTKGALDSTSSPPQSPLIACPEGKGDWDGQPLIKNISSLSPIICVCDNSALPEGGDEKHRMSGGSNSSDQEPPSPNSSQLYKQITKTSDGRSDRASSGSDAAEGDDVADVAAVVLRRDLMKQESKVNLLEEMNVIKYLVLKKESEEGPEIKGGHMDALIIHATKVEKISENAFGEAFITTFRTFITPFELLKKLTYRYEIFHCQVNDQKQRAAKEVFSLLVRVVNDLTMPDIDQNCLNLLMDFVYQLICNGNLALAKVLRLQIMAKVRLYQSRMPLHMDPLSARGVTTNPPTLIDLKSSDIAEQMTLLDSELFQKIEIPEVLLWAQEQCEERSPNLTKFTEHFNKMSYWARSQILKQEDGKEREKYVIKFIKIMKHLRKINNYNSYLALLSALDSAPIRRLEWHKTIREGLKEYCALIDSSSSFRAYRLALAETNPPCIPYIGLVLQDLTFVHIGNPDYLEENVINFSKRWQQYNIVVNMKRFRSSAYPYKKNERICGFFENFENYLDEDAMWQISENIKPRGGRSLQSVK